MHRLLTSLTLCLLIVGSIEASETFSIVFNSGNADSSSPTTKLTDIVLSSTYDFVTSVDAAHTNNIYRAKAGYGIKGSTASIGANLSLVLDTIYTIEQITLYTAAYLNKSDTASTHGLNVCGKELKWKAPRTVLQPYTLSYDNLTTDTIRISALTEKNNRFYIEHMDIVIRDTYPNRPKVQLSTRDFKFPSMEYDSQQAAEDQESFDIRALGISQPGITLTMKKGSTFQVEPASLPCEGGEFTISYSTDAKPSFYDISDTCVITATGINGQPIVRSLAVSTMVYEPKPYVVDSSDMVISVAPKADYYLPIEGLKDSVLKSTLATIINKGPRYRYGSGNHHTWAGFYYTDRDTLTNQVLDMYSLNLRYFNPEKPTASVKDFDIEHMFPKSWWGGDVNSAYCDLFHLVPGDYSANRSKSNHAPGIPTDTTFNNGSFVTGADDVHGLQRVFCPADEYKGDFARAYFYIACCYGDELRWVDTKGSEPAAVLTNDSYLEFCPWLTELLLSWHRLDPVSDKEKNRAVEVNKIQGNRNPFIDYPELIEYIWGNKKNTPAYLADLTPTYTVDDPTTYIPENESVRFVIKRIMNGQLIILRDGRPYSVLGISVQ